MKVNARRSLGTKRAANRRLAPCPLCQKYPRYNEETLAAIREADEIMADIIAGKRKPKSLAETLAELAELAAS